jgi:hypothetical protein
MIVPGHPLREQWIALGGPAPVRFDCSYEEQHLWAMYLRSWRVDTPDGYEFFVSRASALRFAADERARFADTEVTMTFVGTDVAPRSRLPRFKDGAAMAECAADTAARATTPRMSPHRAHIARKVTGLPAYAGISLQGLDAVYCV